MSSLYEIEVESYVPIKTDTKSTGINWSYDNWYVPTNTTPYHINWYYSNAPIYMYQLTCPKRGCKTLNWCELDKEVACKKCGSILKAVTKKADFEVEVG